MGTQKDKEKLMNKIKAIKDEEEKEKEMLEEHYKTKMTKKIVERVDEDEEVPEKVYSSENKAMNKAREALILSENRKLIQDEIKQRKEEEAKFMYEEQLRKEKM